ncbi:MAG: endonuclease/exonuclease/phosphatase family protein, partial [Alphaproteobacteria bacterium]
AFTLALALCTFFAKYWLAELITHWQLHMAVFCLMLCVLLFLKQHQFLGLWMLLLCVGLVIPIGSAFVAAKQPAGTIKDSLRLLQYNIQYRNNEFAQKGVPWILRQDADIVILQEVHQDRANELGPLKEHYPWHKVELNPGRQALSKAIFSKLPVSQYNSEPTGGGHNRYAYMDITLPSGESLHVYELHTPPPMSPQMAEWRMNDLSVIQNVLKKNNHPYKLLVGDLNCTIYSPYFRSILINAHMHHAQQDWQMQGTWPRQAPFFMRIGIDHLLASPAIDIKSRTVGPTLGSDHTPMLYELDVYTIN